MVGVDVVGYSVESSEIEELMNIVQTVEHMHISVDVSIESMVLAQKCLNACVTSANL